MPPTVIRGTQVLDGSIQRADLDVSTVGSAVVAKLVQGTNITLSSTGADSGTGDVTISLGAHATSHLPGGSDAISYPAWTAFTGTITPGSGSFTATASNCAYLQLGKLVFIRIRMTITTLGTGAGTPTIGGLPANALDNTVLIGRERAVNGKVYSLSIGAGTNNGTISDYVNAVPTLASGNQFVFDGVYEAA